MSLPSTRLQLLLVEDSESDAALVIRELGRAGIDVEATRVQTAEALRAALPARPWDAIICDFSLPGFGAGSALDEVRRAGFDLPFLLVSGTIPDQSAVDLMRQGAHDYILKDNLTRLAPALQRELKEARSRRDRRRAEQELARSQALFHSLVDTLPAAVFRTDGQGRFVFVNSQFCSARGQPAEAILGTEVFDPGDPGLSARMKAIELEVTTTGRTVQAEETIRRPGAPVCHIAVVTSPVRAPDGRIDGVQGFYWDVTARHASEAARQEMEGQLRQIQKMEAIGQLSGGVAHDFNNILTVIKGNAALLETEPTLPPDLRDLVIDISRAAKRAAKLTNQLLTFSRRQNLHPTTVDLHETISNLAKMLQRLVGEHIAMRMNFAAGHAGVHADPSMIDQVILNLVVNARDAMPDGGRIELGTEIREIDARAVEINADARPGSFVKLTVRDTGHGMTPAVRARIFEPFFTTKDVGKGTGLGLAVVYGIVNQHKGWIEVESEPGQGSAFHVFLPHAPGSNPPIEPARGAVIERGGKESILVVEDEVTVRQFVRAVLVRLGYEVHEASSGRNALALWPELRDRVQLVVTDIVMPDGVSGRDLARHIQQDRPNLPILFISGYSTEHAGPDFLHGHGLNFVPKPFTPREIAVAVRNLLDARRA
jgi:two-component system cell cycle sensor histidine kinase/response regulator CckA